MVKFDKATKKLTVIVGDIYNYHTPLALQQSNKGYVVVHAPETHKTLAQQREIARAICASVREGIRFILLTNSDTILMELNNLIMLGRTDLNHLESVREKFKYGSCEFLKSKEVELYVLNSKGEYHKGETCKKYGISVDIMNDVIDEMNDVSDAILYGGE